MSCSWNTLKGQIAPVPEMEFPKTCSDASNYEAGHFSPRNADHLNLGIDSTWDWPPAFMQDQAAVQDDVLFLADPQNYQDAGPDIAGPDITGIVAELKHKTGELEQRMESRINQVEEQIGKLQNGLEEETARLCAEINAQIKVLKAWSAQIKKHIEKATQIHGLQDE